MEPSVYLLMAVHCHQPVGNFGFVFEEAFRRAYEPFLSALERHPAIRISLHYSGSLLDWFAQRKSAFLDRLRRLAKQNQVEFLASGYYEPILPLIPEPDREGQIRLMQRAIRRQFRMRPSGLWLSERVWEPELPSTLARCGIRYTLLDANQFRVAANLLPGRLQLRDDYAWDFFGCYVSEYAGSSVVLFPTSKRLRYWMPFQEVSRTIEFLRRLAQQAPVAITYADDGEKFGLWPKTHHWVYEQGWLEQFFSAVEGESSWLKTATFSDYLSRYSPDGRAYLPCGSYEEMLEWSGGTFRNFFVKYPEANAMYQKMLVVSQRLQEVRSAECGVRSSRKRPSKARRIPHSASRIPQLIRRAQHELYKAQCNDAYWHGVFGGLYLASLRRSVYSHLIAAERLVQHASGRRVPRELLDLDGDGQMELVVRAGELSLVVDPTENGALTELVDYKKAVNLVDTLARRYEPYHEKLRPKSLVPVPVPTDSQAPPSIHELLGVKEEGLEAYLAYDDHRRACFLDYALDTMPTLEDVTRSTLNRLCLWPGGPWDLCSDTGRRAPSGCATVRLIRRVQGGILRKSISLWRRQPRISFHYEVEGLAVPVIGLEFNLCLRDERLCQAGWQDTVKTFQVRDPSVGIALTVTIDPPATLSHFPIETVSESEEGLERTFQGLAIVCLWPTANAQGFSCGLQWAIEDL